MRICVFQSCFEELQASVGETQELCMNPGVFTTQHTVVHKTIHKATAKEQIDQAVAEGYDFYLNFMWGTHDDSLAGVDAIRYFESLDLPSAGVESSEREQSKWDFFAAAKKAGRPLVPGTEKYPLFVKPASSYGSMFIDEHSLCRDEDELQKCIARLNGLMRPVRIQRAQALGWTDAEEYVRDMESAGRYSSDIVVREFIPGEEYSVVVIAMGETPVPLIPQRAKYKKIDDKPQILTLELKFDAESGYELLSEEEDPALWKHLQETAVEAFTAKKMYTNRMGCDVDMRIGSDGRAYVIEVDPLPVFFYPLGSQLEDTDVKYGFPGSYPAVVNTYITNYFLMNPSRRSPHFNEVAALFDDLSMTMAMRDSSWILPEITYQGTVLDLGCGIGNVGDALRAREQKGITELIGVDISRKMLDRCYHYGGYTELVHDRMEVHLSKRAEMVDHIFCAFALEFLPMEELYFVLARCFQLAKQSITLVIDNSAGSPERELLYALDQAESVKMFQIQRGWHLEPAGAVLCRESQAHIFHFQRH
ncbi:hypothetical protein N7470_001249 [Penicillium chermesinum]|nr:hypothetical protein N7470_001249 [Penicillium chermesinum]